MLDIDDHAAFFQVLNDLIFLERIKSEFRKSRFPKRRIHNTFQVIQDLTGKKHVIKVRQLCTLAGVTQLTEDSIPVAMDSSDKKEVIFLTLFIRYFRIRVQKKERTVTQVIRRLTAIDLVK